MKGNKKYILAISIVLIAGITTFWLVMLSMARQDILYTYNATIKDTCMVLWLSSYFAVFCVLSKKSKRKTIATALIFTVVFLVQMSFIYNTYNYIEIQHYYYWQHSVTFFEVMAAEIKYDFAFRDFRYIQLFVLLFSLCIAKSILFSDVFKGIVSKFIDYITGEDLKREYLEEFRLEQETDTIQKSINLNRMKINLYKENPSKGRLNSQARSLARKIEK